jgi:cobyrinic acid a,c-diamide synthase
MAHLYLSATHKSSGKTTLSIGLTGAPLRAAIGCSRSRRGRTTSIRCGSPRPPGRSCLNLDYHTTPIDEIRGPSQRALLPSGCFGFIEGNVGLFDSVDLRAATATPNWPSCSARRWCWWSMRRA